MREIWVWSLGQEDPLEKEMATHPSILAWRIPWREELGGLQPMGSQSAGHDWMTNTFLVLPARAVDRQIHIQTRLVYSSDTLKWIFFPSIQSETVSWEGGHVYMVLSPAETWPLWTVLFVAPSLTCGSTPRLSPGTSAPLSLSVLSSRKQGSQPPSGTWLWWLYLAQA